MFSHSFYLQLYDHLLHHKNIYCNHRKLGSNILYCVSFNTFCDMVPFLRVVWRIHETVLTKCASFFCYVFPFVSTRKLKSLCGQFSMVFKMTIVSPFCSCFAITLPIYAICFGHYKLFLFKRYFIVCATNMQAHSPS